jgi:zinc protease
MRQSGTQTTAAVTLKTAVMAKAAVLVTLASLILLLALRPAFAEVKVEEVVSSGGITAWLVRDETVPVTAIEFSFKGWRRS